MHTCILAPGGSSSGVMNLGLAWATEWDRLSKTKQNRQTKTTTKLKWNQSKIQCVLREQVGTPTLRILMSFYGLTEQLAIYGLPMRASAWPGHTFHTFIFHCLLSKLRGHCYQCYQRLLWNALSSHKNITVRPQPLPARATCSKRGACNQENPVQHHCSKVHGPFPSFL